MDQTLLPALIDHHSSQLLEIETVIKLNQASLFDLIPLIESEGEEALDYIIETAIKIKINLARKYQTQRIIKHLTTLKQS